MPYSSLFGASLATLHRKPTARRRALCRCVLVHRRQTPARHLLAEPLVLQGLPLRPGTGDFMGLKGHRNCEFTH